MKLNWNVDYACRTSSTDVTRNELELMVNCMAENDIKNYLEVGVWHGATFYNVVNLFKLNGVTIDAYAYDCFNDGVEGENSHTSGWPDINIVKNLMKDFSNVSIIAGAANQVDKVLKKKKFDFVFHDANHTKNAIIEDLLVLKNVLNKNAYVAIHNSAYDEPGRNFYGKTAIDELVFEGQYKFIATADCSTLLQNM